jgi:hypothetical protein
MVHTVPFLAEVYTGFLRGGWIAVKQRQTIAPYHARTRHIAPYHATFFLENGLTADP